MTELGQPDRELTPNGSARRRYLAILFTDLTDSARLVAGMEAEDYAALLASVRRLYDEIITRHGGTIIQIVGDGLLASFGYPRAGENDGRRATEAALELHEAVARLPLRSPLSLHTGIHAGLVLLGDGDAVSGQLRLFGNPVNIAARLSDAAVGGEILVSNETLGAERHFFETCGEFQLPLQGMDVPVPVCRIIGRTAVNTRFEARNARGLTAFAGRQGELQRLLAGVTAIQSGRRDAVTIVAAPGLGKTRLAEEFLAKAATDGVKILRGYCESYLSAEPMQPFRQMLRQLCGITYAMPPAQASDVLARAITALDPVLEPSIPPLLRGLSLAAAGAGAPERPAPEKTLAAIVRLVDTLAAREPLILFIDDWQWADDTTHHVLAALRQLPRPILFLLASREAAPGDAAIRDSEVLNLAPLSAGETELTISRLLPGRVTFDVAEIRDYSGGNPLFVEELCHATLQDGDRARTGRPPSAKAWLEKLIEARVERLSPAQIDLVRTAAVIGNVIPCGLLDSLTGRGGDDPLLQTLADKDLIYPGDLPHTLRFKHGIARDVIYGSVGLRERRALHLRIAETLQDQTTGNGQEELYEPLAYHYAAGGDVARSAHFAELAGDKAMSASALDRAQMQYGAALAALDPAEPDAYRRWMLIAQRLALASMFDPSREQLGVLERALALASARGDQQSMAFAEFWVGYIAYALGQSRRGLVHLEAAAARAEQLGDGPLLTQIRASLGQAYAAACDYDKALHFLDEAIGVKSAHRSGRPAVGLAYSLACKASVLGDCGDFNAAEGCFAEALDVIRGGSPEVTGSVLCWRAGVQLWQGRWDDARRSADDALAAAERVKSLYLFAMSRALGAYADWGKSRCPDSVQTLIDATTWLEDSDRELFISLNHGWLTECLAASGRREAARLQAARALRRARKQDVIGGAMTLRALARLAAADQAGGPPEVYLARAMANARARSSSHEIAKTLVCEAEIRLARGEGREAAALLDRAEAKFEAMDMAWHVQAARDLRRQL
jgi:class 3 adenylate cyclase/tetratricopeptide (TPR) repeat protein